MAIEQTIPQEQETQQAGAQQPAETPTLGGGAAAPELGAGQPAQQTGQQQPAQPKRKGSGAGTRFSNLRKYIAANTGSQMGKQVASGIEKQQKQVAESIQKQKEQTQQQAEAERQRLQQGQQLIKSQEEGGQGLFEAGQTAAFAQDITPQAQQPAAQQATGTEGVAAQPQAQPAPDFSQFGQTAAERLGAFQQLKAGETGGVGIQDPTQITQDITGLQEKAALAGTEKGRFQLLRETFGGPQGLGYTTGQQRLDQLLLQASPEQAQALAQSAQAAVPAVQAQMEQLQQLAQSEDAAVRAQAQDIAGQIGQQLYGEAGQPVIDPETGQITEVGGALGGFQEQLAGKEAAFQEQMGRRFEALQEKLGTGADLSEQEMRQIGIDTPEEVAQFQETQAIKKEQVQNLNNLNIASEQLTSGQQFTPELAESLAPQIGMDPAMMSLLSKPNKNSSDVRKILSNRDAHVVVPGYFTSAAIPNDLPLSASDEEITSHPAFARLVNTLYSRSDNAQFGGMGIYEAKELKNKALSHIKSVRSKMDAKTQDMQNKIAARSEGITANAADLGSYLGGYQAQPSDLARIASQEDFARQAALQSLSGQQFGPLQQQQLGLAGTSGDIQLDYNLQQALSKARDYYGV